MTEGEWLADTNPAYLMRHVHTRPWRKRCLYVCACWSTVRDLLVREGSRSALRRLERVAEAEPPHDTFESVADTFLAVGVHEGGRAWREWRAPFSFDKDRLRLEAADLAAGAAGDSDNGVSYVDWYRLGGELEASSEQVAKDWNELGRGLCELARCVFGNPFRPAPVVAPAWLGWNGGTLKKLAQAAYAERAMPDGTLEPARLTVLADALEDAGCTDAELLAHLRSPGPHVRGCWVVDLLLARQ
jgi:hypothetical protein